MENEYYPGGYVEKCMNCLAGEDIKESIIDIVEEVVSKQHIVKFLVFTKRCCSSVS